MGRPPSNGGPSFRFNPAEIAEMESILQAHKIAMPAREVLVTLAEKFSNSEERKGKIEVQMKQVWNWFQNRRYAIRAKAGKSPGKLNFTQMPRVDDPTMVKGIGVPQPTQPHTASSATIRSMPQVQQHPTVPSAAVRTFPQPPQNAIPFSVHSAGRVPDNNSQMEYEAKSARDGAWYDVSTFLSHRSLETGDPEVMVRFAGFGAEEDEWVNVRKNVRQRSLPCEASECVAVLPADLILCFQEGKEQALYFDAHVLDAQRRRHDVRGCRCRFLVRYDHDQSEEIVALRKICRRPDTDYRLQQLHAVNESLSVNQSKNGTNNNIHTVSTLRVYPPVEVQLKVEPPAVVVPPPETPQKRQKVVDAPENQQKVQPVLTAPAPAPSDLPLVEQEKVADEVPDEMQKVQPVTAGEPETQREEESGVAEPQGEPMVVSSSSVEVQTQLPDASAMETKSAVQTETKAEVQTELPQVQPATSAVDVSEVKAEVQEELPHVQPDSAPVETKAEVQVELAQVQPEAMETEAEVQVELPEVQPATEGEAIETKAEVQEEFTKVQPQPANEVEAVETEADVPEKLPEVQLETAVETKVDVPAELPQVQPASVLEEVETKAEVPEELPKVQPEAMETKTEEPVVPVIFNDSNDAEVAMELETEEPVGPVETEVVEAEIEGPKDREIMESDEKNVKEDEHANVVDNASNDNVESSDLQTGTVTDDMEQVYVDDR